MSKEKQIEEMAREMCHLSAECKTCQICNERYHGDDDDLCYFRCVAKEIINHGYRKQSYGEWIETQREWDFDPYFYTDYTCSVCGDREQDKRHFCPHCGAKMDE